jgi:hypothetical protein
MCEIALSRGQYGERERPGSNLSIDQDLTVEDPVAIAPGTDHLRQI